MAVSVFASSCTILAEAPRVPRGCPPLPLSFCSGQVACAPKLREKWLPLVWSRKTERRLFLPHAEVRDWSGGTRRGGKEGGRGEDLFLPSRLGVTQRTFSSFLRERGNATMPQLSPSPLKRQKKIEIVS